MGLERSHDEPSTTVESTPGNSTPVDVPDEGGTNIPDTENMDPGLTVPATPSGTSTADISNVPDGSGNPLGLDEGKSEESTETMSEVSRTNEYREVDETFDSLVGGINTYDGTVYTEGAEVREISVKSGELDLGDGNGVQKTLEISIKKYEHGRGDELKGEHISTYTLKRVGDTYEVEAHSSDDPRNMGGIHRTKLSADEAMSQLEAVGEQVRKGIERSEGFRRIDLQKAKSYTDAERSRAEDDLNRSMDDIGMV